MQTNIDSFPGLDTGGRGHTYSTLLLGGPAGRNFSVKHDFLKRGHYKDQGGNFMSWILVEKKRAYVTHVHGRHSKHVTTADRASFKQFILSCSYFLFQSVYKKKF